VRGYSKTRHGAGSWHAERRAIASIEATRVGLDIRFVVTNLDRGSAEWQGGRRRRTFSSHIVEIASAPDAG
jgi:hypothetical protein